MDAQPPTPFLIRSWNLLARDFTHHNQPTHGNGPAKGERIDRLEAAWQTRGRYRLATAALLTCGADAVCLQECGADFFAPLWNPQAPELEALYHVFPARSSGGQPGAVVFLKKAHTPLKRAPGVPPKAIRGHGFGGFSKTASAVLVTVAGQPEPVWIVSGHFGFEAADRAKHFAAIGAVVGAAPVVLAGDFNATAPTLASSADPWFQSLQRVENEAPTGLNKDLTVPVNIDHVFWRGLVGLAPQAFAEKRPTPPWRAATALAGRGTVVGASDHVWLDVGFQPQG